MQLKSLTDNFTLVPVSFGVGLILSGHFLQGILAVAIGAVAYWKNSKPTMHIKSKSHSSPFMQSVITKEVADLPHKKNSETHHEEPPPIDNWYYAKEEEVVGPLLESEMIALMKSEEIAGDTLVFNAEVGDEWRVLEDTHFIKKNHHRGY